MTYHATRLQYDPRREILWKALCDCVFNRMAGERAHVLDLGAGYCHFINNIRAAKKTAIDISADALRYAAPGVEAVTGSVTDLSFLPDASVHLAFASNLFEHLTKDEFASVLQQLKTKLKPGGKLAVVQPNFRTAFRKYFDDYTHISVYSHVSLCDFMMANGFRIVECRPRFLPFSVISWLPVSRLLIRLYLAMPWKPFAGQMLVVAEPGGLDGA